MPEAQRQPSGLDTTASILGALGKLSCLIAFLLFWIPFSGIILYAFVGKTGLIIAGVILLAIIVVAVDAGRKQSRLWRCPHCNGTFKPFEGSSAFCPHCHATVTPPLGARAPATPPTVPSTEERPMRTCPDCAETVLAAARRCRYCGYEFAE